MLTKCNGKASFYRDKLERNIEKLENHDQFYHVKYKHIISHINVDGKYNLSRT